MVNVSIFAVRLILILPNAILNVKCQTLRLHIVFYTPCIFSLLKIQMDSFQSRLWGVQKGPAWGSQAVLWLAEDFKDCDIATGHSQLSHESRILKKSILTFTGSCSKDRFSFKHCWRILEKLWEGRHTFQNLQRGMEWVTVIQMRKIYVWRTFSVCPYDEKAFT